MCMEDVRIGRASKSAEILLTVQAASQQAVSPDPLRIGLVLGAPLAGTFTYSMETPAVAGLGINLVAGQTPVVLSIQRDGDLVRRGWFVIADAANRLGAVYETFFLEEELKRGQT